MMYEGLSLFGPICKWVLWKISRMWAKTAGLKEGSALKRRGEARKDFFNEILQRSMKIHGSRNAGLSGNLMVISVGQCKLIWLYPLTLTVYNS